MRKIIVILAAGLIAAGSPAWAQSGQYGPGQISGNSTAAGRQAAPENVTAILDRALGATRGAILERGASGWAIVGPGATAGLAWISGGAGADPSYGVLGLSGGGCNAALTASNGGILWSNATQCQIMAGTATARLPLLSGASATPVWGAYTLPASVTSGGIAYFSSTSAQSSSALLAANGLMIGGGAGAAPSTIPVGINGQLLLGVTGSAPAMASMSQDCTITNAGVITCAKTNNVAFAASATTDTTNAANISSGTLPAGRMPALTGDCTTSVNTVATTCTKVNGVDQTASWATYTPTVTAGGGTFTTVSATGRYRQIGKTIILEAYVTITTAGTASGQLKVSLPVNAAAFNYVGIAKESALTGKSGAAQILGATDATTMSAIDSVGTTFIASGGTVNYGITYETP